MITLICATNRPQNQTLKVVEKYSEILNHLQQEVRVLAMEELPADFLKSESFGNRTDGFENLVQQKIKKAHKFVIISPEYNGSYPGVFKAFIDAIPPNLWKGKRIALVGVASGKAGNLRGMDHLTHVLHHLRAEVFSYKLPISRLDELTNEAGELIDQETINQLQKQAEEFVNF